MIEIIPNWHPILVHFTIGLLITAAALFAAGVLLRWRPAARSLTEAARWNLWIGTAFAIVTVATGLQAYFSVTHDDPAHAAMTIHLKSALVTLGLILAAALLAWRDRPREVGAGRWLAIVLVAGTGSLVVTGYLGGENVYRHGLGVMRLPEAEGPGHEHSHGAGAEDHASADAHDHVETPPAEDHNAGHSHGSDERAATAAETGHSHGPGDGADAAAGEARGGHGHASGVLSHSARAAAEVVDAFHAALSAVDLERARALLDPQVRVFESGNVERSAEEYAAHHMPGDAGFMSSADVRIDSRIGDASGGLAWVASQSRISAEVDGKALSLVSTETMVLRETPEGWRISHVHWSSRPTDAE